MDKNTIRSIIFLVAGLILMLFPKQVYKFQAYVLDKLHVKYEKGKSLKGNFYIGIILIIISIGLFIFSIYY